jgi:hypothetical protein
MRDEQPPVKKQAHNSSLHSRDITSREGTRRQRQVHTERSTRENEEVEDACLLNVRRIKMSIDASEL